MGGNVEAIKERLGIEEVLASYVKLEKAGANFKAKCPFHNEKTASFLVSPSRRSYYCFGCGAKGDIFTFVQEMEGVEFKEALKTLAERAGVELVYESKQGTDEREKIFSALEDTTIFFEGELKKSTEALAYLKKRGVSEETIKEWRIGFAQDEWRKLREFLRGQGYSDELLLKAGLVKKVEDDKGKEPYDVFRGRVMFPIFDTSGRVIAFSGRSLDPEAQAKYLNSPETALFTKSEVLYGLDKAKMDIRKKDYTVLVEGQLDLLLSHQAGVKNTVASSGTAFTQQHLERLKKLSPRILLAFDGDAAGLKAAERSTVLALGLGLEVKIARLPEGSDPADLAKEDPQKWKDVLRNAKPAVEIFLDEVLKREKDPRKAGKLVEKTILPLILLHQSSIERAHFVSLIAKKTGLKEDIIWEDVKRAKAPAVDISRRASTEESEPKARRSRTEELIEVRKWLEENPKDESLRRHEAELERLIQIDELDVRIIDLQRLAASGDAQALVEVAGLARERDEARRKVV